MRKIIICACSTYIIDKYVLIDEIYFILTLKNLNSLCIGLYTNMFTYLHIYILTYIHTHIHIHMYIQSKNEILLLGNGSSLKSLEKSKKVKDSGRSFID